MIVDTTNRILRTTLLVTYFLHKRGTGESPNWKVCYFWRTHSIETRPIWAIQQIKKFMTIHANYTNFSVLLTVTSVFLDYCMPSCGCLLIKYNQYSLQYWSDDRFSSWPKILPAQIHRRWEVYPRTLELPKCIPGAICRHSNRGESLRVLIRLVGLCYS